MTATVPFLLLDDARTQGASSAHLYEAPRDVFVARRAQDVAKVLADARSAQAKGGGHLAGCLAYEAGLALEPRLEHLTDERAGANGPLVWLGLFDERREIRGCDVPAWLESRAPGEARIGPLTAQLSTGAYVIRFEELREAIAAGEIYQANLTYPLQGSYSGDPLALYRRLRGASEAGYGGVLFDGTHWLLSLSPELFVSLKDGEVRAKPMKGTRARGGSVQEDEALRQELAQSPKERAENLMIVDLMRNDLARIAEPGSVVVEQPFEVETYPSLHQMVTSVRAQLAGECSILDLVRAIFPCGSITGAPKIRAMELIHEVEPVARGPYCGALGRIDPPDEAGKSDAAFNVAIRTLRLTETENHQGHAVLGIGSAIVADSDAMAERRECEVKAGFARRSSPTMTAPHFDLIETMRFEPDTGIALLEMHLQRMKASARALGFAFDRHEARNTIQALCFELEAPSRVRLLCTRSGEIALEALRLADEVAGPLPCIALPLPIDPSDWRLRHKTSDRAFYDEAREAARRYNAREALLVRADGYLTEGSFTNVFIEREGTLLTPPAELGLLAGVLRRSLIEEGRAREARITLADLEGGFFLGNAVRGLVEAHLVP